MQATYESHEDGLNLDRAKDFMTAYGLALKPYIIIDAEDVERFNASVRYASHHDPTTVAGVYDEQLDMFYVFRNPELESRSGSLAIEAIFVHEGSHSSTKHPSTGFADLDTENPEILKLRSGFTVDDHGAYFEEGFADLLSHRYVTEALELPDGLSGIGGSQMLSMGLSNVYRMPGSFWIPSQNGTKLATAAHAAVGLELLIAKDPSLFPTMIEGRKSAAGLRDMIRKINALMPGMYSIFANQLYDDSTFMACTKYIVYTLYDGDTEAAADVMLHPSKLLLAS